MKLSIVNLSIDRETTYKLFNDDLLDPIGFHVSRPKSETEMSSTAFGLHVSNTSMCLVVSKEGKTDVVASPTGDRTTPAMVAFQVSFKGKSRHAE